MGTLCLLGCAGLAPPLWPLPVQVPSACVIVCSCARAARTHNVENVVKSIAMCC